MFMIVDEINERDQMDTQFDNIEWARRPQEVAYELVAGMIEANPNECRKMKR